MLRKKRFGLAKAVYEIEQLLLHCKYVKEKTYISYLSVSEAGKERYRKRIAEIIKEFAVNKEFLRAIAKDVIHKSKDENGKEIYSYNLEREVFKYMKKNLYRGDSRKLLGDLIEVLKDE
jgi:hypothetical protein